MKRVLLIVAMLLAGLLSGAASAFGVEWAQGPEVERVAPKADEAEELSFVPTGAILTPLIYPDGSLVGYASIEVQLQVPAEQAESIKQRMPLLLHTINLQTYRKPLAAGPDGTLPDLALFRRLVLGAATPVFGRGTVRQAAITQARPA